MGAEGNIIIANAVYFKAANPGVKPGHIGLYEGTVLGVEACWGYIGDNLFEPNYGDEWSLANVYLPDEPVGQRFRPTTAAERKARERALAWFQGHSESHEVWT